MTVASTELHVADGLASAFDLQSLHYGILLHTRKVDGSSAKDEFDFRPFRDSKSNPLSLPGIEQDDERIEFERGHGTPLDRRLVRKSAFRLAPTAATGQGVGSLQQVYLVVKPKWNTAIDSALGLLWLSGPAGPATVCPTDGLKPMHLWSTDEWQGIGSFVQDTPYTGDIVKWLAELAEGARRLVLLRDPADPAASRPPVPALPAPSALPAPANSVPGDATLPQQDEATAKPSIRGPMTQPARLDYGSTTKVQSHGSATTTRRTALIGLALGVVVLTGYWFHSRRPVPAPSPVRESSPGPRTDTAASSEVVPSKPLPLAEHPQTANCKYDPFPLHCELRKQNQKKGLPP